MSDSVAVLRCSKVQSSVSVAAEIFDSHQWTNLCQA